MNKINSLRKHKYSALIFFLLAMGIGVVVIKIIDVLNPPNEDHIKRGWPGGIHGYLATNLEKAEADIEFQLGRLLPYISYCKRFPFNLVEAYKPIENAPNECSPLKPKHYKMVTPWVDPWGRVYQIRYNKNRMKLQMRSLGRRLDDPSDDIVREINLSVEKDVYNDELEKCKSLQNGYKGCAFKREWQ